MSDQRTIPKPAPPGGPDTPARRAWRNHFVNGDCQPAVDRPARPALTDPGVCSTCGTTVLPPA